MVSAPVERFLFRGEAVGFAGHLTRPKLPIAAQASVSLPIIGGESTGEASGYRSRDGILTIRSSTSVARGGFGTKFAPFPATRATKTRTSVETTLRGVKIDNGARVLTVERIHGTLISTHGRGRKEQTSVQLSGAAIEGLQIDGAALDVSFARQFAGKRRLDDLKYAYERDADFYRKYRRLIAGQPRKTTTAPRGRKLPLQERMLFCTIVSGVRWKSASHTAPGVEIDDEDHRITIKDFGTVFLGEFVVDSHGRRLVMVRVELGSPVVGKLQLGGINTNGHGWPP